ncbi:unnamed protein product, partial [Meganyctiphanes norvegica]
DALKTASLLPPWTKEALRAASELDWSGVLDSPAGGGSSSGGNVVLNDRLMTEASLGVISQLSNLGSLGTLSSLGNLSTLLAQHQQEGITANALPGGPIVKTEHSYSLDTERPEAAAVVNVKADTTDIESECFPAIPISEAEGTCSSSTTSSAPTLSSVTSSDEDEDEDTSSNSNFIITTSTSNTPSFNTSLASSLASLARKVSSASTSTGVLNSLPTFTTNSIKSEFHQTSSIINVPSIKTSIGLARPAAVVVTQRSGPSRGSGTSTHTIHTTTPSPSRTSLSGLTLRLSSAGSSPTSSETGFSMPPTPPSCSGSDSEYGGNSPTRTTPLYEHLTPQFCNPRKSCTRITVSSRNPINTPLISTQPKGVTGPVNLTEEEKRTLVSEGYTIPARLPLTKTEEKSLKKIRRKIKNKISAQESRRKKKEYMDALERKVESISQENLDYKRRLEALQTSNSQLLVELHRLQSAVAHDEKQRRRSTPIATITN